MSEKIVQLNEEIIKGQLKELVRGSVEETLNENYCKWCYADGTYTYSSAAGPWPAALSSKGSRRRKAAFRPRNRKAHRLKDGVTHA